MTFGSPRLKLALSDFGQMLNVSLWVGGSMAATKLLELLADYDFGEYQVVAMGVINVVAVLVKKFITDTRVEVTDAGV